LTADPPARGAAIPADPPALPPVEVAVEPPHERWAAVDAFDRGVSEWMEARHTPALDRFFYGLSSAADHSLLWFAIGTARAVRRGRPRIALRLGAAMAFESALTNGLVKSAFRRVRPPAHSSHPQEGPLPYGMRRPITSSFPSGHATAAFTAVGLLSAGSPRPVRPLWYGMAALVAGSRVYVRMHHASDVIAGAAFGIVLGRALRRVLPLE
jgi:undecaprenyl-diphosphatase